MWIRIYCNADTDPCSKAAAMWIRIHIQIRIQEAKNRSAWIKKKMQTWKILYTGILFVVFSDFLNCTGIY